MKLRDLLEGDTSLTMDHVEAWCSSGPHGKRPYSFQDKNNHETPVIIKDDKVKIGNSSFPTCFISKIAGGNDKFVCPFKPSDWDSKSVITFSKLVIEDFNSIPDAFCITFEECDIKSLKGIEKLKNVEYLNFDKCFQVDRTKPGLLRILKMVNLEKVSITGLMMALLSDIICKHAKGDKNIADCQQELIEAGLKEFAKL